MEPKSIFLILFHFTPLVMSAYNVVDFGAKPDGLTDSAQAFLATWAKACGDSKPATMVVPSGGFLMGRALFKGPCKNSNLRLFIKGTLLGKTGFSAATEWITFKYVNGLSIYGGTFNARGQALWACKAAGRKCPNGSTALTISQSKNILLSKLNIQNSQSFQIAVIFTQSLKIEKTLISAPADSPNTDGIHLHMSTSIAVTATTIATGDDCISIGEGVSDAWIEGIACGPGHGISIGSLGDGVGESLVENVTVSSVVFTGTQNGFRVKTWATESSNGFVRGITFRHGVMNDVGNPILIEQNYCPVPGKCPNESSGIKISKVTFNDVNGTSSTPIAIKFDCSKSNPCQEIQLTNINLSYKGKKQILAKSFCRNVRGRNSGFVVPPSCLR